ncbi:hypothetical protein [Saliterribacillus persicus]|uniref:hypothetical protein n=1 Tax=Saliterribacillus persicus TaxID=930114 RepID=UPI0014737EC2|nr:hypothetical protein [Saliterribacillus persicus]
MSRKSLNLPLAKTGESHGVKRLRRENELLLQRLKQIQAGPFGIYEWFRKCKKK